MLVQLFTSVLASLRADVSQTLVRHWINVKNFRFHDLIVVVRINNLNSSKRIGEYLLSFAVHQGKFPVQALKFYVLQKLPFFQNLMHEAKVAYFKHPPNRHVGQVLAGERH